MNFTLQSQICPMSILTVSEYPNSSFCLGVGGEMYRLHHGYEVICVRSSTLARETHPGKAEIGEVF